MQKQKGEDMSQLLIADSTVRSILKWGAIALLIMVAIIAIVLLAMPRKTLKLIVEKVKTYFNAHKTFGEILRFLIVGGIATLIDMFVMGVVMYFMQRDIYPSFLNVFINSPNPSTTATIVGTTVGFIVGTIVNYILSILFVFNEKGKSKTAGGFVAFVVLSVIGLFINIGGMYLGYNIIGWNQWIVKIIMVIVVLIYNYISKRLLLFTNKKLKTTNNKSTESETNPLNEADQNSGSDKKDGMPNA